MPRQFNLDDHYSFLQAFDKLGLHMFGEEWTGTEAWAKPAEDLESRLSRKRSIEDQITDLQMQCLPLNRDFQRATNPEKQKRLDAEITELNQKIRDLQLNSANLPDYSDSHIRDNHLYERRQEAEAALIKALTGKNIQAQYGTSFLIDWKAWCREGGFKYSLPLSMAVVGPARSSMRRAPLFIVKASFDSWLYLEIASELQNESAYDAQELCEAFIREAAQNSVWRPKEEIKAEAKARVTGLSDRAFDRAWAAAAPEKWKQSGRRLSAN